MEGLELTTLRPRPELRLRVRWFTNWATQMPHHSHFNDEGTEAQRD